MAKKEQEILDQAEKAHVTEADLMWEEIKNLPIGMYSIPGQLIHMHVERLNILPNMLHLRLRSPAVIVGLDSVLNSDRLGRFEHKFDVDIAENGYVTIKRFVPVSEASDSKKK